VELGQEEEASAFANFLNICNYQKKKRNKQIERIQRVEQTNKEEEENAGEGKQICFKIVIKVCNNKVLVLV
jgi:hypothetical protein